MSEFVSLNKELACIKAKIDKLGEIINCDHQLITDLNRKFDMLFNDGTKNPVTEVVTQNQTKTSKANINILSIFQDKFIADQTAWDSLFTSETYRIDLFNQHKSEWEDKSNDEKLKIQCEILFKSLTTAQKNKVKKMIKAFQVEIVDPVVKDIVVEEESTIVEEEPPKKERKSKKTDPDAPKKRGKAAAKPDAPKKRGKKTTTHEESDLDEIVASEPKKRVKKAAD